MGEKYEHASHYNCCCGRGINVHHPPSAPFVITTPRGATKERTHQESISLCWCSSSSRWGTTSRIRHLVHRCSLLVNYHHLDHVVVPVCAGRVVDAIAAPSVSAVRLTFFSFLPRVRNRYFIFAKSTSRELYPILSHPMPNWWKTMAWRSEGWVIFHEVVAGAGQGPPIIPSDSD